MQPTSSITLYNTKPSRRFFSYLLSFIGLQRLVDDSTTSIQHTLCTSLHSVQPSESAYSPSSTSSTCSFLTGSTLLVDDSDTGDKWKSHETDLVPLQKSNLIVLPTRYALILAEHASYAPRSLGLVREGAKHAAHRLDSLRPSQQFAKASEVADELEALVHFCMSSLYRDSPMCLLGLVAIAQEGLEAPPEVKQYVFGHAKLGRLLTLGIINVFKNFHGSAADGADLLACIDAICSSMARYDATWTFRQDYEQAVVLASHSLTT